MTPVAPELDELTITIVVDNPTDTLSSAAATCGGVAVAFLVDPRRS
jgi:hypothetical protein